ncbi:MAG: PAS domain-containing protein, partial [Bacillota bacterium]|nr:PAS domain-containing protein [Bacillota bacterium]
MIKKKTSLDTIEEFCYCWFRERNIQKTLDFMTEDISFVGTGEGEYAKGKEAMHTYLEQDIQEIPEPFSCELTLIDQHCITENIYSISMDMVLANSMYSWILRGFFIVEEINCRWFVKNLHFAEPSRNQHNGEHYPRSMVVENASKQRDRLLNEFLPGGIMSGYIEKDFPFCFINQRMLDYLGYENEEEFCQDIDGLLRNCIYPDDWYEFNKTLEREIISEEGSGEYSVEYRIRKKDGSFIWVHDCGRRAIAEDGRPVINTLSIDVTDQIRAQRDLLNLYNNIPGAVFRCRFDEYFSVIDANDG